MEFSNNPEQPSKDSEPNPSRKFLRTALLVGGSALLGGLAVAIFNRKGIATIHEEVGKKSMDARDVEHTEDI